jgi:hypothetical protein
MRARLQRQPLRAGRTPRPRLASGRVAGAPVGIGTAIGRIGDELAQGRVAGAAPLDRTGIDAGGQIEPVLQKPEQRLAHAAEFGDLVDGEPDRRLYAPVGIHLEVVTDLDEAHGRRNHEFATTGLLITRRERALTQEIELVLVEAAFEPEEQTIVAQTRRVDRLLIDEQGIDDAAHLHELLPVAAVAGEAGDLAGGHGADLAQAYLGDHALEAGARGAAGSRAAKVVVDDLDLCEAELARRSRMAYWSPWLSRLC